MGNNSDKNAERILNALKGYGSSLENLEHADLTMDTLEHLAATNPEIKAAIDKIANKPGGGNAGQIKNFRAQLAAADVSINITRKITKGAASLPANLPAPFFGVLEYESNYSRVINQNLPQDGSITYVGMQKTSDAQGLVFTYKNADDSIEETITIRGEDTVYTNLLRAMGGAAFTIVKPKMIINNALDADQFGISLKYFYGSMFTEYKNDTINPNKYKTDYLSDNTVRILQVAVGIDPEHCYIPMIKPISVAPGLNATFLLNTVISIQEFRKFSEYDNKSPKAGFHKV